MIYEIHTTHQFDKWLRSIKDRKNKDRLTQRISNMSFGHFGDHRALKDNVLELRFFFGSGYRVYYTIQKYKIILLLCGGDKSTQTRDISLAKKLLNDLEKDNEH